MNPDEAYRHLAEADELPREALQWSLDNWDVASPRFISKLRAYAAGTAGPDPSLDALFYILHLCGEKCDARAYTPLCEIIATDDTLAEWLGDAAFETLPGILINICDGDVEPLQRAIESAPGDEFARGAALSALAYLVRAKNVMTDDDMRAYLMKLGREMQPRDESYLWSTWSFAIAQLGYETLRAEVARVFAKGWIDKEEAELEDFYALLQLSHRDPDGLAAFTEAEIRPFGATIETLGEWELNSEIDFDPEAEPEGDAEQPFVNALRDVGRNDPCPCGSGKKYKKCCLVA